MHFRSKIQPVDADDVAEEPAPKSRLKRLFERQFSLKNFSGGDPSLSRGNSGEFEPSSFCLRKMVQNYIEDPNNGGRNRCNCFSGSCTDSSDEEEEFPGEALRRVKTIEIVEKDNIRKRKDDSRLKAVVDGLVALGYDASLCKSRWKKSKSSSCPAGEYEYLDVMVGGKRVLIDIDFKSKFEIARPTKTYKLILQSLPYVFVGQVDLLKKIVIVVCEAAKWSLKKKGLHVPPWRKAKFVLTKWLSPYVRAKQSQRESGDGGVEAYKVK